MSNQIQPYDRLQSMGGDKLREVETLMVQRVSAPKIAEKITGEWGYPFPKTPLIRQLQRYQKNVVAPRVAALVRKADPKKVKAQEDAFDAVDALLEAIQVQQQRIEKIRKVENQSPMLMGGVQREVEQLRKLLDSYVRSGVQTGAIKKEPDRLIAAIGKAQQDFADQSELLEQIEEHNEVRLAATDIIQTLFSEDHLVPEPDWKELETDFGIKKP